MKCDTIQDARVYVMNSGIIELLEEESDLDGLIDYLYHWGEAFATFENLLGEYIEIEMGHDPTDYGLVYDPELSWVMR